MTHGHTHHHDAPGAVPVLDIGGDVGALLVYLDGPTPTGELEAQPVGAPDRRFHTGVHPRELFGATTYVALYPEVTAGDYEILDHRIAPIAVTTVDGGAVTELDLRAR